MMKLILVLSDCRSQSSVEFCRQWYKNTKTLKVLKKNICLIKNFRMKEKLELNQSGAFNKTIKNLNNSQGIHF